MSPTSLMDKPDVRALFRKAFEFEPVNVGAPMKAPPLTTNYTLVGTAFDYLARFWLERQHAVAYSQTWIAERAAINLSVQCGEYVGAVFDGETRLIPKAEWDWSSKLPVGCTSMRYTWEKDTTIAKAATTARDTVNAAKCVVDSYLKSGEASEDLFRAALMLGRLDPIFSTGQPEHVSKPILWGDIEDLHNLWNVLVDGDLCGVPGPVWLNPTFDNALVRLRNHNADFIADDTLVDIKTTKKDRFTRSMFDQIAGYCVLDYLSAKRGRQRKPEGASLKQTGIYFARHGVLMTVDTDRIYHAPTFDRFVDEFQALAKKRHGIISQEAPSIGGEAHNVHAVMEPSPDAVTEHADHEIGRFSGFVSRLRRCLGA